MNIEKKKNALGKCIEALTNKQFELQCEKAMHSVQTINCDEYIKMMNKSYMLFLLQEKNHYLRFLEIASCSNEFSIPLASRRLTNLDGIHNKPCVHILSLDHFISNLMGNEGEKIKNNLNNPSFVNTLSFSLFPAISTYFHVNLTPKNNQTREIPNDVLDFQIHNYNNVFTYISQKIDVQNIEEAILYQDLFDILMRPLFASPLFINFCIHFFQPIFSEIQNFEILKENFQGFSISNYLTSKFEEYYDTCIHLLPSYIVINLNSSNDPSRTIYRSFFEIALRNAETAQFYGLFHYSKPPSSDLLKELRKILCGSYNSEVILGFVTRLRSVGDIVLKQMIEWREKDDSGVANIQTCSCSETMLTNKGDHIYDDDSRAILALEMKKYFFEEDSFIEHNRSIFRKVLLSDRDISLLEYIYNRGDHNLFNPCNARSDQFYFINFGFSEDGDDDTNDDEALLNTSLNSTVRDDPFAISPNLRHLLQNSDPIPKFRKIPEDMSLAKFFEDYLVRRGPIATLPKRIMNNNVIFNLLSRKSTDKAKIIQIINSLPETSFEQDKEIGLLTNATNINKKLVKILALINDININTELIDNLVLFNEKNSNYLQKFKHSFNQDYIKNPSQFISDFRSNKSIFPKAKIVVMKMIDKKKELKFWLSEKIVYSSFIFDYQSAFNQYQQLDIKINKFITRNCKEIIDALLESHFPTENLQKPSRLKINKFICNKIRNIPKVRKEIILTCSEAFSDCSILRRLDLFGIMFHLNMQYLESNLPDSIGCIGEDERTPIMGIVILLSKPLYLASTAMFLKTYFTNIEDNTLPTQSFSMSNYSSSSLIDLKDILKQNQELRNLSDDLYESLNNVIQKLSE